MSHRVELGGLGLCQARGEESGRGWNASRVRGGAFCRVPNGGAWITSEGQSFSLPREKREEKNRAVGCVREDRKRV